MFMGVSFRAVQFNSRRIYETTIQYSLCCRLWSQREGGVMCSSKPSLLSSNNLPIDLEDTHAYRELEVNMSALKDLCLRDFE
jgi:hypothetical protein